MSYVRIDTPAASQAFEVETVEEALAGYARAAGYGSYAELASTLGKTVEEAKANLSIEHVTAADIIRDIADEAMASDPSEDGADRFASAREWADWCVAGQDGDAVLALARAQGLDETPLLAALRQILSERDLAGINAAFDAA